MSTTRDPFDDDDDSALEPVSAPKGAKKKAERLAVSPGEPIETDDVDAVLAFAPCNDFGNAKRLQTRFGDGLMHVRQIGWFGWDGARWDHEGGGDRATKVGHQVAQAVVREAKALEEQDAKKYEGRVDTLYRWAVQTGNTARVNGMLAAAAPYLDVPVEALDADVFLLATPDGRTIELGRAHTEVRESNRADYITRSVTVNYDPRAKCPLWEQFLSEVMPKEENRAFLQRIAGLCLTGSTRDSSFFLFWGGGDNGKSTFMNIIRAIMGDYAMSSPVSTFLAKREGFGGGGASPDLARLPGARLVTAAEPPEGARLDEGAIKEMTGGEKMTVRHLNQGFFEFRPQFKVIIGTNHRPTIRGTDHGIWKRVKLVPWTVKIAKDKIDRGLEAKLRGELAGIFQWMLRGCEDWAVNGLNPPPDAVAAVEEYRADQDVVGEFLKACCTLTGDMINEHTGRPFEAPVKRLRDRFLAWCKEEGNDTPLSSRAFGEKLIARGLRRRKSGGVSIYVGVHLPEEHEAVV